MPQFQSDNNFWTSPFRKLLVSTKNDKKLRVINEILKKTVQHFDQYDDRFIKRCEPSFNSVVEMENKQTELPAEFNNNNANYIQTTDLDEVEIGTEYVYQTIPLETPNIETSKQNKNVIYQNIEITRKEMAQRGIESCKINENLNRNSTPVKLKVEEKINHFEKISNPNYKFKATKANKARVVLEKKVDEFSPIKNNNKHRQDRFVVNLYKSRVLNNNLDIPNNQSANIVEEISEAYVSPDKILKRSIECKSNRNRVVYPYVLEAFEKMEETNNVMEELDNLARSEELLYKNEPYQEEPIYATPNKLETKKKQLTNEINNNNYNTFKKLKQQADIQCKVMKQAAKALEVCKNSKCSSDQSLVEAERILLTASMKYQKLLQVIRQSDYEKLNLNDNIADVSVGNIRIELLNRKEPEWFICIVSNEKEVFHTDVVYVQPEIDILKFKDNFNFENVSSDFSIKIDIYSLKLKKQTESKYKLKRVASLCKKSKKLLYTDLQTHQMTESTVPESSFINSGSLILTVSELTRKSKFKILATSNSSLNGEINLKAEITNIKFDTFKSGFITIGSQNGYLWNRRWAVLEGTELKFWNYPNEADERDPIEVIELNKCIKEICNASRSICPRPRTLLLEMSGDKKYFLNADCIGDMHVWRNKLNEVFCLLRSWKMLNLQKEAEV